jgi:hypothetical protein
MPPQPRSSSPAHASRPAEQSRNRVCSVAAAPIPNDDSKDLGRGEAVSSGRLVGWEPLNTVVVGARS